MTAYEMRISDWSSDVCSSDLRPAGGTAAPGEGARLRPRGVPRAGADHLLPALVHRGRGGTRPLVRDRNAGRRDGAAVSRVAADRHRDRKVVVQGTSASVGVTLGGRRSIKQTNQTITNINNLSID